MVREQGCMEITIVRILVPVVKKHVKCVLNDGPVQIWKFENVHCGAVLAKTRKLLGTLLHGSDDRADFVDSYENSC